MGPVLFRAGSISRVDELDQLGSDGTEYSVLRSTRELYCMEIDGVEKIWSSSGSTERCAVVRCTSSLTNQKKANQSTDAGK